MGQTIDLHQEIESQFTDIYEQTLPPEKVRSFELHLEDCSRCKEAYEEFKTTVAALSGLHRMSAPQQFGKNVETTIHKRSAGRFFGRRAWGDRVPFALLTMIALGIGTFVVWTIRCSGTGTFPY